MSGLSLADDIVVFGTIVIAIVTVPALGPDACRNLLAGWRRITYRGEFKVTSGTYSETADLNQAIRNEFGPNYKLADWSEIKTASGSDVQKWVDGIGLKYGIDYFVSRNSQEWNEIEPVSDGTRVIENKRHYFVTRFDHDPVERYGIHDSIGNHLLTLGSWYDIQNHAIAIKAPQAS